MKKFFKDNLPKPDDLKKYKALGILGNSIFEKELWSINKHTLSRAIAIGLFWGWMPMFFQMIPAAFCAVYFRANLPLSVAGVWASFSRYLECLSPVLAVRISGHYEI